MIQRNLTDVSVMQIQNFFNEVIHLPETFMKDFASHCKRVTYPAGHTLVSQHESCEHFWLLEKGLIRCFFKRQGKEVTHRFVQEGSLITSMESWVNKAPSGYSIELLERSTVFEIPFESIKILYSKYPEMYALQTKIYELYFMKFTDMIESFQALNATDRYRRFMDRFPSLIQRVSLQHIASCIGITPETLSRIRAKKTLFAAAI
jgi:CRP/FNR family transcriptional regulator, anaerobic regulatory protein